MTACVDDDKPCHPLVHEGQELEIRVLERWTTESTTVKPRTASESRAEEQSCGDQLDLAPGDTSVVQVDSSRKLAQDCIANWGNVRGLDGVEFGVRIEEPRVVGDIIVANEVRMASGCTGEWHAMIDLARQSDPFAPADPSNAPPGVLRRQFYPTSAPDV